MTCLILIYHVSFLNPMVCLFEYKPGIYFSNSIAPMVIMSKTNRNNSAILAHHTLEKSLFFIQLDKKHPIFEFWWCFFLATKALLRNTLHMCITHCIVLSTKQQSHTDYTPAQGITEVLPNLTGVNLPTLHS